MEDKTVQQAVVTILNQIYEEDFLGFSYGFRPGRSQHQALDALSYALLKKKVNYVLDADIRGFFDNLDLSGHPKTGQRWSGQNRPTGRGRGLSCSTLQPAVEASPFSYANSEDHI